MEGILHLMQAKRVSPVEDNYCDFEMMEDGKRAININEERISSEK